MDEMARRAFIKSASIGALAFSVGGVDMLLTPRQARAQGAVFKVLSPAEVGTLEAVGDTLAIGAREAGIAHFVDQQLTQPAPLALLSVRVNLHQHRARHRHQISAHSARTFSKPRNRNWRNPRACLICPNTDSGSCLRSR